MRNTSLAMARLCLGASLAAMCVAQSAMAQTAPDPASIALADTGATPAPAQEIVVLGSRIAR
ncbi:hypothetical protein ACE4Z6_27180, partial [Salmonella enterica]|uniref:hypothetical protein n=1 Tax=Salmonella enterica TaxID=28901 RepID=UPI003D2B5A47